MAVPSPERRNTVLFRWKAREDPGPDDPVPAEVIRNFPIADLEGVERVWGPVRAIAAASGEHSHWNWVAKSQGNRAGYHTFVAVECDNAIQGLMAVCNELRPARLEPAGRSILYVDFVEIAPWNLKGRASNPRFVGIGTVLVAEAIRMSRAKGANGCLGLHSLEQAEGFYDGCLMTRGERDIYYHDLVYFEYTQEQADGWFAEVDVP